MNYDFLSAIDEKAALLEAASDYLWEHPETAFTEFLSAEYLCRVLREEGFTVTERVAGIDTAFTGSFGSGRPVIGILGEYDALSGLGQAALVTTPQPTGQPCGHGCGHNLLGTASLGAALAVKRYLETTGHSGTVIYYGCPGEEGGSGKAFMARDGAFDGLDAAITWHPGNFTGVRFKTSLANCQVLYRFDGVASHAGAKPHLGRSALDAVTLMNVGANFLREHLVQEARLHYAVTDTGGFSPNVVQPHAEVLYLLRAPHSEQVQEIYARVNDIAKGAALMTGTTESHEFIKACSETILNDTLQQTMYEEMLALGEPAVTEEELAYARALTEEALSGLPGTDPAHPIHSEICPFHPGDVQPDYGSTDVGDVSWVCPTVQASASTLASGTPGHSWQCTAQGKGPLAQTMLRYAAKAMAATAVRLAEDPALLRAAQEEHRRRVGAGYVCPIPQGVKPRPMTSFQK